MSARDDSTKRAILAALTPLQLATGLGLKPEKRGRDAGVCCPVHGERTPSMSLKQRDGGVGVKCFACGWTGDALKLIAAVEDTRTFPETLARAAELAGMLAEADEIRGGKPAPARAPLPPREPEPERDYPPIDDVARLWSSCLPIAGDPEASAMLAARRIDPAAVDAAGLARALHPDTHWSSVPTWARFKGRLERAEPWTRTGHRVIVPVYDACGRMRSVRAWLVRPSDILPKRVPPAGHKGSGLVLANARAVRWLRGETSPSAIVLVEGEPDFLVRSLAFPHETVVGIGSGSWTAEFAARVPYGSEVAILTHLDGAGDRYAGAITSTVAGRAQVFRWTLDTEETAA